MRHSHAAGAQSFAHDPEHHVMLFALRTEAADASSGNVTLWAWAPDDDQWA
jgi:hypothetical protein